MVHGKITFIPVSEEGTTFVVLEVHSVVFYRETGKFIRLQGGASITAAETETTISWQTQGYSQ